MTAVFNENYASLYDTLYSEKDSKAECDIIATTFGLFGERNISRILDLGCGTGRHAVELAARGFNVTGIDFSEAMLSQARKRVHTGRGTLDFFHGDARAYRSEIPFDAVLMNFNVLGYMHTNEDFVAALATARANLRTAGLFVADFWFGPAVVADPPRENLREIVVGDTRLLRYSSGTHEPNLQQIRISIRIIELEGNRVRADTEEIHVMRYYFPLEFELALRTCGFRRVALMGYPDISQPVSAQKWLAAVVAVAI